MNYAFRDIKVEAPRKLIKPRRFRPAHQVKEAEFMLEPPACFVAEKRRSESQKLGIRYEKQALEALDQGAKFDLFVPSPWIAFTDHSGRRVCQPDALGFHEGPNGPVATILEIKLVHTIMAFWQLRRLYEPVIRRMFPKYHVRVCEVTKSFDPFTPWPERIVLCPELPALKQLDADAFGVITWRR